MPALIHIPDPSSHEPIRNPILLPCPTFTPNLWYPKVDAAVANAQVSVAAKAAVLDAAMQKATDLVKQRDQELQAAAAAATRAAERGDVGAIMANVAALQSG